MASDEKEAKLSDSIPPLDELRGMKKADLIRELSKCAIRLDSLDEAGAVDGDLKSRKLSAFEDRAVSWYSRLVAAYKGSGSSPLDRVNSARSCMTQLMTERRAVDIKVGQIYDIALEELADHLLECEREYEDEMVAYEKRKAEQKKK